MSKSTTNEPTGHLPKPSDGKKKRKTRQSKRKLYQKIREDLQISGDLETVSEGALKSEVVNPLTQSNAPLPHLVSQAIRNGWAVPENKKPDLVDELIKILDDPEQPTKVKVAAFNALRLGDQQQWERDHPQEAAKIKGGNNTTKVNVINNTSVQVGEVFSDIESIESSIRTILEEKPQPPQQEQQVYTESTSHIRADSDAQSMDASQSNNSETQSETN